VAPAPHAFPESKCYFFISVVDAADPRDIKKLQFLLNDKFIMADWLLHILQDKVNSVEIWCI
jgi:hypothetical protein